MTRNEIDFNTIDLNKICGEKTFEIFAVKLTTNTVNMIVCCIHIYPSRNLD